MEIELDELWDASKKCTKQASELGNPYEVMEALGAYGDWEDFNTKLAGRAAKSFLKNDGEKMLDAGYDVTNEQVFMALLAGFMGGFSAGAAAVLQAVADREAEELDRMVNP